MSEQRKKFDIQLELNPEHGTMTSFMLWNALTEALLHSAQIRGNDGWKEDLQARVHHILENADETETGDQSLLDRDAATVGPEAREAGLKMVDAAFDRIKFR